MVSLGSSLRCLVITKRAWRVQGVVPKTDRTVCGLRKQNASAVAYYFEVQKEVQIEANRTKEMNEGLGHQIM